MSSSPSLVLHGFKACELEHVKLQLMNLPQVDKKNNMVFHLSNMCIMGTIHGTNKTCPTKKSKARFSLGYMGTLMELCVAIFFSSNF